MLGHQFFKCMTADTYSASCSLVELCINTVAVEKILGFSLQIYLLICRFGISSGGVNVKLGKCLRFVFPLLLHLKRAMFSSHREGLLRCPLIISCFGWRY
jgi:hypothetical protein